MNSNAIIIFTTNFPQYAIDGYKVHAMDFILKPIKYYTIEAKLQKALEIIKEREDKYIVVNTGEGRIRLALNDILYIEKQKNYAVYHTHSKKNQKERINISKLYQKLKEYGFSLCRSGCLVNLKNVTKISADSLQIEGTEIPISRGMQKSFLRESVAYLGSHYL